MSMLPLRALACAAAACREFKEAYLHKAAEERAHLMGVAQETYGQDAVSALVAAIEPPMCGSPPSASLTREPEGNELFKPDSNELFHPAAGQIREPDSNKLSHPSASLVLKPDSNELFHPAPSNPLICYARTRNPSDHRDPRLLERLSSHGGAITIHKPLTNSWMAAPLTSHLFAAYLNHGDVEGPGGPLPLLEGQDAGEPVGPLPPLEGQDAGEPDELPPLEDVEDVGEPVEPLPFMLQLASLWDSDPPGLLVSFLQGFWPPAAALPFLSGLDVHRIGSTNVRLKLRVRKPVAAAVMGVLLAVCTETPEGCSSYRRSPLTTFLEFYDLPRGETGIREAMDLVAPLRPLAESVTFRSYSEDLPPLLVERKVQARPLGVLHVLVH